MGQLDSPAWCPEDSGKASKGGTFNGESVPDGTKRTSGKDGPERTLEEDNPGYKGPDVTVSSNLPNGLWPGSGTYKH